MKVWRARKADEEGGKKGGREGKEERGEDAVTNWS